MSQGQKRVAFYTLGCKLNFRNIYNCRQFADMATNGFSRFGSRRVRH